MWTEMVHKLKVHKPYLDGTTYVPGCICTILVHILFHCICTSGVHNHVPFLPPFVYLLGTYFARSCTSEVHFFAPFSIRILYHLWYLTGTLFCAFDIIRSECPSSLHLKCASCIQRSQRLIQQIDKLGL